MNEPVLTSQADALKFRKTTQSSLDGNLDSVPSASAINKYAFHFQQLTVISHNRYESLIWLLGGPLNRSAIGRSLGRRLTLLSQQCAPEPGQGSRGRVRVAKGQRVRRRYRGRRRRPHDIAAGRKAMSALSPSRKSRGTTWRST